MKAVIVEIKDNVAAVLSEDGRISKIRNKKYSVGQEIVLKKTNTYIKIAASSAAAMMLFTTTAWAYFTPYSYVSIDINPSFEFSINRFDRVLNVKAMNYDGEKVTDEIGVSGLKNKEIKEAVKTVIVELKSQGYIDDENRVGIVVAASSKSQEKTDMLAEKLKTAVEKEITNTVGDKGLPLPASDDDNKNVSNAEEKSAKPKNTTKTEVLKNKSDIKENDKYSEKNKEDEGKKDKKGKARIKIIEVSSSYVDTARANGVTPGKLSIVEQLKEKALKDGREFGENEFKSWLDKPVKDIMKEINKYNKEEREIKKTYDKDKEEKEDDNKEEKREEEIKDEEEKAVSKEKEIIKNNNYNNKEKEVKKDNREKEEKKNNKEKEENKDNKDKKDKKDNKNNKNNQDNKSKKNNSPGDKVKKSKQ